jgi:hypothetical protein
MKTVEKMLIRLLAKTKKISTTNQHESRQDKPTARVFKFVFIRVHSWLVALSGIDRS